MDVKQLLVITTISILVLSLGIDGLSFLEPKKVRMSEPVIREVAPVLVGVPLVKVQARILQHKVVEHNRQARELGRSGPAKRIARLR